MIRRDNTINQLTDREWLSERLKAGKSYAQILIELGYDEVEAKFYAPKVVYWIKKHGLPLNKVRGAKRKYDNPEDRKAAIKKSVENSMQKYKDDPKNEQLSLGYIPTFFKREVEQIKGTSSFYCFFSACLNVLKDNNLVELIKPEMTRLENGTGLRIQTVSDSEPSEEEIHEELAV